MSTPTDTLNVLESPLHNWPEMLGAPVVGTVKLIAPIAEPGFIASLNVTEMRLVDLLTEVPVGVMLRIVGATVSAGGLGFSTTGCVAVVVPALTVNRTVFETRGGCPTSIVTE